MKTLFALIFFILLPQVVLCEEAQAAELTVLRCHFTEPFFNTVYTTHRNGIEQKQGPLDIEMYFEEKLKTLGVTMSKETANGQLEKLTFTLLNSDKVILQIVKNNQGSDGMTDIIYPYEVIFTNDGFTFYGGCNVEVVNPNDSVPMS